ncbi:MAG TPA: xanthine dehydrogenase family protein subunit M [Verrucomicrobiae bacterium]|nr:xanthine dehydrogenase family protein subunit M [Verrucomicrobiae bacterium]
MAIAHQFEYVKPGTLREGIKTLARYGNRAQVLAGGTDLIGLMADEMVRPEIVVDIKGIPGLDKIEFKNGVLIIGALVTFSDLRDSPVIANKFPVIWEMTGWLASVGIRNRATMVGNLCSAVPCCDSGPILQVYDAAILVAGPAGRRKVALCDWFLGPRKTMLKRGEIATGVAVTLPKKKHAACFVKLRRYEGEDLAQASVTVLVLAGNSYRISFGAVAPRPIRAEKIEALLEGKPLSDELIRQAVRLVPEEIAPITDIRATKEYRAHMIGVMLERGLRAAVARLAGTGPEYGTSLI